MSGVQVTLVNDPEVRRREEFSSLEELWGCNVGFTDTVS